MDPLESGHGSAMEPLWAETFRPATQRPAIFLGFSAIFRSAAAYLGRGLAA
jgi:hypothetical protein